MLAKRKSEKFDFLELLFQINRYDKEVSLNVVVCLWIAFDTFAKKKEKKKWLYIRKTLGKIPQ